MRSPQRIITPAHDPGPLSNPLLRGRGSRFGLRQTQLHPDGNRRELGEYKSQMLRFTCDAMESMAVTLEAIAQLDALMAEAEVILDRAQFPSSSCERFRPPRCRYRSVAGRDALGENFALSRPTD